MTTPNRPEFPVVVTLPAPSATPPPLGDDGLDGNTVSRLLDELLELEGTGALPVKVLDEQGNLLSVRTVLWDTENNWFVLLAEVE